MVLITQIKDNSIFPKKSQAKTRRAINDNKVIIGETQNTLNSKIGTK